MNDVQVILSDQSIITTGSTLESQTSQEQEQQKGNNSPITTTASIEQEKKGDEEKKKKKENEEEKQQKGDEFNQPNDNNKGNGKNNGKNNNDDNNDNNDGNNNNNNNNDDAEKQEEDPEKEREHERVVKKFEKAQDTISGCVDDQEGFDVYQMCAFLSKQARFLPLDIMAVIEDDKPGDRGSSPTPNKGSSHVHRDKHGRTISRHSTAALARRIPVDQRVSKLQYYLCILRAAAVAVLQIWSLALTIQELIDQADVCRGTFDIYSFSKASSKIIFAGYVALIGINVLSWINGVRTSGMYSALSDNECILPDLVDQGWLIAGRTINYVVLICAIWASFLIIYLSESVLDMILNSIAIYFVLELDNMVMSPSDYKQVAAYIDEYQWDLEERINDYIHRKEQPIEPETRECNVFKMLFDFGTWLISATVVTPVIYFTAFVAFCVAPVYFIVCL